MLPIHSDAQKRGEIKAIFIHMDKDQSGFLTPDEIRQGVAERNVDISVEELNRRIAAADLDGDGRINYREFLVMF